MSAVHWLLLVVALAVGCGIAAFAASLDDDWPGDDLP